MKKKQSLYFCNTNYGQIFCVVFMSYIMYVNLVLVCAHFYHNLWNDRDGLKGLFGFKLTTLKLIWQKEDISMVKMYTL